MQFRQHLVCFALGAALWLAGRSDGASPASATNHWAFQPLVAPPIPIVKAHSRVRSPVDAFVFARLEAAGLRPAPTAAPAALQRRLSFDLTGLPPVAGESEQVEKRGSGGADFARWIEGYLASPQFGERWARWWLDAVGHVDVLGVDNDAATVKLAEGKWRYRDYVVQSFNDDKPFSRFLTEQLAGDELTDWRGAESLTGEMRELLVATGFLRVAPDDTDEGELNTPDVRHALLQQTVETVGANLLGLTFNCARCHDHKYEPVSQADYYGFLAHFAPALNPAAWRQPKDRVLADLAPGPKAELEQHNARLDREAAALRERQQAIRDRYRDQFLEMRLPQVPAELRAEARVAARTPFEKRTEEQRRLVGRFERQLRFATDEIKAALAPTDRAEWSRLDAELAVVNARRKTPPQLHAVYDTGPATPVHVLRRGEHDKPGEAVEPALPVVLRGSPSSSDLHAVGPTSGRRLALARQLTAPDSRAAALVTRVIVNRVWQQLFGRGLVESSDNLGVSGARPTHPELLDWLAGEFIRNGWRLKPLLRVILTSSTYQQAASAEAAQAARATSVDPDNQLLWRQRLRRLDSEMVRDALLAVGGQLDLTPGGPPVLTTNLPDGSVVVNGAALRQPQDAFRRSLYLLQRRNYHPSLLATFDQPSLTANCTRRQTSAVVSQSLAMLNDGFVLDAARALGERVCAARAGAEERVVLAFELALARRPAATEVKWCAAAVEAEGVRRLLAGESVEAARNGAIAHLCHTLLNTSEFLSIP